MTAAAPTATALSKTASGGAPTPAGGLDPEVTRTVNPILNDELDPNPRRFAATLAGVAITAVIGALFVVGGQSGAGLALMAAAPLLAVIAVTRVYRRQAVANQQLELAMAEAAERREAVRRVSEPVGDMADAGLARIAIALMCLAGGAGLHLVFGLVSAVAR